MLINGKNVQFLKTVKVNFDLKKICPNESMDRLGELFDTDLVSIDEVYKNSMEVIKILNAGWEDYLHHQNKEYKQNYITDEDMLYLADDEFSALFNEALEAYQGKKPTIETEPKKKTEESA